MSSSRVLSFSNGKEKSTLKVEYNKKGDLQLPYKREYHQEKGDKDRQMINLGEYTQVKDTQVQGLPGAYQGPTRGLPGPTRAFQGPIRGLSEGPIRGLSEA